MSDRAQKMDDLFRALALKIAETDGTMLPGDQARVVAVILAGSAASQPDPLRAFQTVASYLTEAFADFTTDPEFLAKREAKMAPPKDPNGTN